MTWTMPCDGATIELTKEETLGLIHVLHSIIHQTESEIEVPTLEHPCYRTEAPIKPLLVKLLNAAVSAEYIIPAFPHPRV